MGGKSTRIGAHKCYECRKPFTVKVGTIFESSHVALRFWLQAIFLIASSKKGISANQLHRTLGVTLKTAWFMGHRIREAMKDGSMDKFGHGGGIVEIDETYISRDVRKSKPKFGPAGKIRVLSLVDRKSGRSRSMVVDSMQIKDLMPILKANISSQAHIMTDEAPVYNRLMFNFRSHHTVNHSKDEYVNKEYPIVHTNTIEGFFSVFKRGMKGTYQHCGQGHVQRYLNEFDFRYSNRKSIGVDDHARAEKLLQGVIGKRLTYAAGN
jgi:hypothetical protein